MLIFKNLFNRKSKEVSQPVKELKFKFILKIRYKDGRVDSFGSNPIKPSDFNVNSIDKVKCMWFKPFRGIVVWMASNQKRYYTYTYSQGCLVLDRDNLASVRVEIEEV